MASHRWRVEIEGNKWRRNDEESRNRSSDIARETSHAVLGLNSEGFRPGTSSFSFDQMGMLQNVWSVDSDDTQQSFRNSRRVAISNILSHIHQEFDQEKNSSVQRQWCNEVPRGLKLETVQSYLRAMHDESTLPTESCAICLIQNAPTDIRRCQWQSQFSALLKQSLAAKIQCTTCFPTDQNDGYTRICKDCDQDIRCDKQPQNCGGDLRFLTCAHLYPSALRGLTIAEERLISLNVPYGYITRYCKPTSTGTSWHYRQHKKGHITVYVNDLDSLTATVLPHPLIKMMESIRVCWSGAQVPSAVDLSRLMSVRRHKVIEALRWKKSHDTLYANVHIDEDRIRTWDLEPGTSVPTAIWDHLEKIDDSLASDIRSAPIVSGLDRPDQDEPRDEELESLINEVVEEVVGVQSDLGSTSGPDQVNIDSTDEFPEGLGDSILSSGLFPLDGNSVHDDADRLDFIRDAISGRQSSSGDRAQVSGNGYEPFINVGRHHHFANSFEQDFWAKTFGLLFPYGLGGPTSTKAPDAINGVSLPIRNLSLRRWLSIVLRQSGGRFAVHPAFSFLAFDMLLRSTNRQISSARMQQANYSRLVQLHREISVDQDRLERAQAELKANGRTSDQEVTAVLRELSVYSKNHPFSSEARRKSRGHIESLCVDSGLPAIWFTVNPNDLDHPIRIRLSNKRLANPETLQLQNDIIAGRWENVSHASSDPLSAAQFFHREMELFFKHYVRLGQASIFGRVKHYIGLVETNERHSLHLHGMIWFYGAFDLPLIINTLQNPHEETFRKRVVLFLENLISKNVDYESGRNDQKSRNLQDVNFAMVNCQMDLDEQFERQANFSAYCRQLHTHTLTCVKHIPRQELINRAEEGRSEHESERKRKRRQYDLRASLCRFQFPKKLVSESFIDDDGVVHLRRNNRMVNNYNQSMAVGLRHNHDIDLILTRSRAFALSRYIMYYATKSRLPITAGISAVLALQRGHADQSAQSSVSVNEQNLSATEAARQFWMKLANRVSSEVEVSAVEVCSSLLEYPTEYCSVQKENWSYLNLNILFWTIFQQWSFLRSFTSDGGDQAPGNDYVAFTGTGRRLSLVEAYQHRGDLLSHLCLYDYARIIKITKLRRGVIPTASTQIPLERNSNIESDFIQELRSVSELATVSMANGPALYSATSSPSGINRYIICC